MTDSDSAKPGLTCPLETIRLLRGACCLVDAVAGTAAAVGPKLELGDIARFRPLFEDVLGVCGRWGTSGRSWGLTSDDGSS